MKSSYILFGLVLILLFGFIAGCTSSTQTTNSSNTNTMSTVTGSQQNNSNGQNSSVTNPYPTNSSTSTSTQITNTSSNNGLLPLGDGLYSNSPKAGYIYSCQTSFNAAQGGASTAGPWIQGKYWNLSKKVAVSGSVSWPNSKVSITVQGTNRMIISNGLPNHPTGVFPIASSDAAYSYDRNPNSIKEQNLSISLTANPTAAASPSCVGMGMIGIMTNGVPIFNGFDAGGRDAAANEVQDSCQGHPQQDGQYHYHSGSSCLNDTIVNGTSSLLGYALDGFGIYGSYDNGKKLSSADLDVCHGTTSMVMWDGKLVSMYHYVITDDFPYTIACFKGTPITVAQSTSAGNGPPGQNGHMPPPQ